MLTARRAGDRRQVVSLQSVTARTASDDGYTETWTTYATVRAAVIPQAASSSDRLVANTIDTPITHTVEMDYRSDLAVAHRLLLGTRPLYIRGWQNVDERNRTLILSCEERVA